jgi:hypothetical protein
MYQSIIDPAGTMIITVLVLKLEKRFNQRSLQYVDLFGDRRSLHGTAFLP